MHGRSFLNAGTAWLEYIMILEGKKSTEDDIAMLSVVYNGQFGSYIALVLN